MAEIVIQTRRLTKTFGGRFGRSPVVAIRGLDLTVHAGGVTAFVGPNGAGKTTTIHILIGLIQPTAGTAAIFGRDPHDACTRRLLGYQSEIFATYPFYTARQALHFYGSLAGMPTALLRRRVPELLNRMGLEDAMDRQVRYFSKGMTQRLGLAQALIHDPPLLILDEPTSGLDAGGRRLVADILVEETARGKTIFLSSHILPDVERLCDAVVLVNHGELLYAGSLTAMAGQTETWEIDVTGWSEAAAERLRRIPHTVLRSSAGVVSLACDTSVKQQLLLCLLEAQANIVRTMPQTRSLESLYMKMIGGPRA